MRAALLPALVLLSLVPFAAAQPVTGLEVHAPAQTMAAGPQEQLRFPIEVRNSGNVTLRVAFEVAARPEGRWHFVLPPDLLLEPGRSATAVFTVVTPFETGHNKAQGTFLLRAVPSAAHDPSAVGEPKEVAFLALSEGWYAPGPAPALLLAGLAALAIAARRRA